MSKNAYFWITVTIIVKVRKCKRTLKQLAGKITKSIPARNKMPGTPKNMVHPLRKNCNGD